MSSSTTPIRYGHVSELCLVRALWENSAAVGHGVFTEAMRGGAEPTDEELSRCLKPTTSGMIHLDYVFGRPLKVTLDTNTKELWNAHLYDRDAKGRKEGTADSIVAQLLHQTINQ